MPIKTSYVSNINNASGVYIDNPLSAFGDLVTTELTPIIQTDFVHGINNKIFNTTIIKSGTIDTLENT